MRLYLKFLLSLYCVIAISNASTDEVSAPSSLDSSDDESNEFQEDDASLNAKYAQLQWVDKVTGRFKLIDAEVGKTTPCGQLKINISICRHSAPFEPPESKSFMTIWEYPNDRLPKKLFSGWMFASSPVISTLINHSRYNIWLVKCTNKKAEIKKKNITVKQ